MRFGIARVPAFIISSRQSSFTLLESISRAPPISLRNLLQITAQNYPQCLVYAAFLEMSNTLLCLLYRDLQINTFRHAHMARVISVNLPERPLTFMLSSIGVIKFRMP